MKLSDQDQKTYPKLAAYVKIEIPKLKSNGFIYYGLTHCGSLTAAQIHSALDWGNLPLIKIVDMLVIACGAAGPAGPGLYGCTRNAQNIEVAKRVVEGFETNMAKTLSSGGGNNLNAHGKAVYVLGASLLHEMCHWGNNLNGVAEPEEMGLKFERTVYGKTIW